MTTKAREHTRTLTGTIAANSLRAMRTRLLIALDKVYPSNLDDVVLCSLDEESYSQRKVRRELHYLSEKDLVRTEPNALGSLVVWITARGRDFLNGDVSEVGLEPASFLSYEGTDGT